MPDKPPPGLSAKERLKWYQNKKNEKNRLAVEKHRNNNKIDRTKQKPKEQLCDKYRKKLEKVSEEAERNEKRKQNTRERVKRFRNKKRESTKTTERRECSASSSPSLGFQNRMQKCRAVRRVKDIIAPLTPRKRCEILSSLLNDTSPKSKTTRTILENKRVINTKSETVRNKIANAVLTDVKTSMEILSSEKTPPEAKSDALKAASFFIGNSVEQNKLQFALSLSTRLNRRNINKCLKRNKKIINGERNEKEIWKWTERKVRSDKITDEVKTKVYNYWLEHSYPVNDKKQVIRQRIGPKVYLENPKYIISTTQTNIYIQFLKDNPDIKIGQRMFEKLKPFFVKCASRRDRITCLCKRHVEMQTLFKTAKSLRRKVLEEIPGLSEEFPVWTSISDLVNETLYDPVDINGELMFKTACLERSCADCGVENIKLSALEKSNDDDSIVNWQRYEYVNTGKTDRNGKLIKKQKLVSMSTPAGEMWNHVKNVLETYPLHQFQATWQRRQLHNITENLPQNHVIMLHDYSEDFKCELQDEIQSDYFSRNEVTMHVTVLYRHAVMEIDGVDSTESEPNIKKEYLFVLFDDKSHDRDTVHYARSKVINEYLKETLHYDLEVIHEFCDGCSQQYKSKFCLADLSFSQSEFGCVTQRNFFETSHGKGEQDAAGSHVKNKACMSIVRRECQITNAEDMFNFLNKTFKTAAVSTFKSRKDEIKLNRRVFFHAKSSDIERERHNDVTIHAVKNNRQLHSVRRRSKVSMSACQPVNMSRR